MPQVPCPYCGHPHDSTDDGRCVKCNGLFEPLSQTATQLAMGPWYVRDEDNPFMPGFNEAILRQQVRTGRINANTIVRGPTTNQFWMNAGDAPGVSRLMGTCHSCHQEVEPDDTTCGFCKADLLLPDDVDSLGLKYTTDEARAQAQKEIAEGRANPAPKPAPKPTAAPTPAQTSVAPSAAAAAPGQPQQTETSAEPAEAVEHTPALEHVATFDDDNELASELAEDVWNAGQATGRRRRRQKGADPLVIGMGVVLLCVIAVGGFIILTSGTPDGDDDTITDEVVEAAPERDSVAVARASVPVLTVYERLVPEEIPAEFADRYADIKRQVENAQAYKEEERFNEAYNAYKGVEESVTTLEIDIEQWRVNDLAKADASELRGRVSTIRDQAKAAEAEKWAALQWTEGQSAWDDAEKLFTSAQFAEAGEQYTKAESIYVSAESKAQAGQAANNARTALNEAITSSAEGPLRQFANDQIDAVLRLRTEGDGQLNEQEYAKAEQSYSNAMDSLNDAKELVELAQFRKYYAFEAGFQASGMMLGAARGDGVDATAKAALIKLFDKLRIRPNPAAGITPGDDVGFTAAVGPLIDSARDAITEQHGEAVQACYLIGFHASIIDQTLKTIALTDDQQKRIHQSLGVIEEYAAKAGWNTTQLRPILDQVRIANRNADLKQAPEATRAAWKRMISPIQTKSNAPQLMEPGTSPGNANDPELFPTRGS
ncbi:MAG: hypothetical protein AAF085_10625 [Planctomycetota bacterium]